MARRRPLRHVTFTLGLAITLVGLPLAIHRRAAEHYDEHVELEHLNCMVRGDDKCLIKVEFRTNGAHSN